MFGVICFFLCIIRVLQALNFSKSFCFYSFVIDRLYSLTFRHRIRYNVFVNIFSMYHLYFLFVSFLRPYIISRWSFFSFFFNILHFYLPYIRLFKHFDDQMIGHLFINFADIEDIDGVLICSTNIYVNKIVKQLVLNIYYWNIITDLSMKIEDVHTYVTMIYRTITMYR